MTKPSQKLIDEVYAGFTDRSDRGRSARTKGTTFERKVAKLLRALWPNAKRGFGQARDFKENPDVVGTPFWIECSDSSASIQSKMRQAVAASDDCLEPVVVSNHKGQILVTMRLEDWLEICKRRK